MEENKNMAIPERAEPGPISATEYSATHGGGFDETVRLSGEGGTHAEAERIARQLYITPSKADILRTEEYLRGDDH